jgi:hypothetical protein
MKHKIRLATTDDLHFIQDSWLKAASHTYPNQHALDFATHQKQRMQTLIDASVIIVAHLPEDSNELLSYLVYSSFRGNLVIHYSYTKTDARNKGILRSLIGFAAGPNTVPIVFTQAAKNENIMKHYANKFIFDPSVLNVMDFGIK